MRGILADRDHRRPARMRLGHAQVKWLASRVLACVLVCSPTALASPGTEQVRCTDEPRSKWLPEEQIRKIFGADQYAIVKFKVTRTNCYEFYAVTQSGQIIEAYYHPITGKLVKENRL